MEISESLRPGDLGQIVALHGAYYAKHWGFGTVFEAKVARELADFAGRFTETDLALCATDREGLAASLILDLHDPDSGARGAHLRWFIVHDRCRGTGIGRRLVARAVEQAERYCAGRAWLTTFAGLDAARHLYEQHGFGLVREEMGEAWGTRVSEQEFRRGPAA